MRILGLSAACALSVTNAHALDINNNANWALSGIMPVTHSLAEASEEDAVLVLPAHAFEAPHTQPQPFESAPVVAGITKKSGIVVTRPGAMENQDQTQIRVSFISDKTAKSYVTEANPAGEMELLIDDKWRAAEDLYGADFFKAHQ